MAKNHLDAEIRSKIDSFLSDLSTLVKRSALESVTSALTGGGAPARRARAARSRLRKAGRRARRSGADLEKLSGMLVAHVKANPGQRIEQIAKALRRPTSSLKPTVYKLSGTKVLRTKGQKRGMTYFVGRARKVAARKSSRRSAKRRARKAA